MLITLHDWSLIYLVLIIGASLQGLIGFGLGLFSAPLLLLLAPQLVPVPMILNGLVVTSILLFANRQSINKKQAPFSLIGGTIGVVVAAAVMALVNLSHYQVLFGLSIVVAVVLSTIGLTPRISRFTSLMAGSLSGFMGTITSAGGAPMGLLYQKAEQDDIQANLSLFFVYVNALSVVSLSIVGMVKMSDILLFLISLPAILIGWLFSLYLRKITNVRVIRPLILVIALCSGLACIFA